MILAMIMITVESIDQTDRTLSPFLLRWLPSIHPYSIHPLTTFLSDPGKPGVRSMGPDVRQWVRQRGCWDLTDVTLADEDTNSILTDNGNRAIQGNTAWWSNVEPIQVVPLVGQICNLYKWRHLVAKFATNASGAIWWPNLLLMQVAPSGGQIYN